ncbi:MAG: response regulator, partial [Deltaproteobacteria bacterium]|nr:response regulator [Deltaproteobacteria bacterium]
MHSIKTERDRRKSRESRGLKELWMVLKADLPQLLVVCAAFFTLSLLSYFYASNVMKKQVDLYSRSEMQVHHSAIRALLNAHEAALEHASVAVIYAVEKGAGPEEIHELLKTLAEMFSNQKDMKGVFGSVYGFIKGNYLDGTSWIPGEFFYPKTAPWLRGAVLTEGLYHSTPYLDPRTGNAVAAVSKVVYDKNGESVGVLGIDYFLTPIIRQVSEYRVADAGYGILLDDSYNILTCPDPEYVGKHLNEFPGFEEIYRELAKDNPKIRRAQEQADGRPAPQRILVADNKVKGVENIVFFSPLENGWYVGIIVPYPYYYSEVYRMIPVIVLISTFLALVVCVILLRMSKAKKRSEEESLAKTSFLARMSHEIRTPMNAILGMCELARRNIGRPEALEYLSEIRHAGSNLVSIINDILDYSKINTGVIQLKLNPYAAADLFYDTLAIVRVRLGSKEIDLTFEIDPNMPRKLTGDEVRVRQVILNILTNAVKYTPRGFIKFNLDCERKDQNSVWITVRVEDSGVGIKKDDLDSLFDDYVRVDQGGIRHIEGTGLGLAITKSLCLAMNGDIMVESEYGKGSTFTATLEQTVADWTPVGPITSTDRRAATFGDDSEEEELPFTAPGFKVLVVDDIHTNLVVTKGLLQPHEMNVSICDRGHKAVDLAAREQFDLIFVDHMMPEMDGTETMRKIRDINPHYREIPIIALTAAVMAGMREMFLSKGFDDFLGKPIELHKLNAILERWIPKNVRRRAKKPLMRLAKNVSDKESVP